MIMIILTFLSALSIAAVSAWFSIVGIMAIFAGASQSALIMGAVLESGKLVAASWLYRNWKGSPLLLRLPLVVFTCILMFFTSMGIFGYLSKAHVEQGASTSNNTAKIERLDQQIAREQHKIDDSEKMIAQLDAAVNGYTTREKITAAVELRRTQAKQRTQLRDDIASSQALIDQYADQKVELQSEVRKFELEVGPVKYIAALIYDNPADNLESTVRIVILLIVSVFDPFAVILLIAANYSLKKRQDDAESRKKTNSVLQKEMVPEDEKEDTEEETNDLGDSHTQTSSQETEEKSTRVGQDDKRTHKDINNYSSVVENGFGTTTFIRSEISEKVSVNEKEENEEQSSGEFYILSGVAPYTQPSVNSVYQKEVIDQVENLYADMAPHIERPDSTSKPEFTAIPEASLQMSFDYEKETAAPLQDEEDNDIFDEEVKESTGTVSEFEEQASEIEEESGKKADSKKKTVGNYFNKYTGFIPQSVSGETSPDNNLPNISGWLDDERRK